MISQRQSEEIARDRLRVGADVLAEVANTCAADVARAAEIVARAVAGGGKLLLCGNGGSAADCQHVSAEFVSRLTVDFERPGIPAIALTTDTSFLTAFANDVDFQGVFARQVDTLGQPGDVLFGITTSGRSKNVLQAISHARRRGMRVIALVGAQGLATDEADVVIRVPSLETQHIQESHLAIEHVFCHLVERHVYGRSETAAVGPGQNAQKGESPR